MQHNHKPFRWLALGLIFLVISIWAQAQTSKNQLRHVVLFGWKAGADSAAIQQAVAAFAELPRKIKLIRAFEYGTNNSPEKLNQGLTHCFLLTFRSEQDRDAYLIHPTHVAFTKLIGPLVDKVTVVDYWVRR